MHLSEFVFIFKLKICGNNFFSFLSLPFFFVYILLVFNISLFIICRLIHLLFYYRLFAVAKYHLKLCRPDECCTRSYNININNNNNKNIPMNAQNVVKMFMPMKFFAIDVVQFGVHLYCRLLTVIPV